MDANFDMGITKLTKLVYINLEYLKWDGFNRAGVAVEHLCIRIQFYR